MPELTTFASRQPATYIAGTVKPEGWKNTAAMLAESNLANWNVRLRTIETDARSAKETFEVIRDNPFDGGLDRLGIAGERYGVVQNEQAFGMFDDLSPEWEAAGAFKNGALIYGQAKTDKSIVIDRGGINDVIQPLVVVSTTHNGSGALRIGRTGQRMDCLNMFNAIFGNLQHAVSIRHTLSVVDRMKKIRLAWKENDAYFSAMEDEANRLHAIACTNKEFDRLVAQIVGERPELNTKGAQTKFDNSVELFNQAWNGPTNARIKGTRWGALQAIIEKNQWARTIQDTPAGIENFAAAGIGFDEPTNRFRQNALALVKAL